MTLHFVQTDDGKYRWLGKDFSAEGLMPIELASKYFAQAEVTPDQMQRIEDALAQDASRELICIVKEGKRGKRTVSLALAKKPN